MLTAKTVMLIQEIFMPFKNLGERLVPLTSTIMKGVNSEFRENRKVALLPIVDS